MTRRIILLLGTSLFFSISCNVISKRDDKGNKTDSIDSLLQLPNVDSLEKTSVYQDAKWWLYCWHCDDSVAQLFTLSEDLSLPCFKTMGELDLSFDTLITSEKYVSFYFNYSGTDSCPIENLIPKAIIQTGITIQISNDSVFSFADKSTQLLVWSGENPSSRLYNPLQPEVINYIKTNRARINPWFRKEAIRRGVLSDD